MSQRTRGSGQPLLVACSGGADSSALALVLAAVKAPFAIAHVQHDLRDESLATADRLKAESLALALTVPFHWRLVHAATLPGNAEANARRLRYAALADMAKAAGFRYVATAHHAHDQLESLLMALLRGSSLRGLSGIHRARYLSEGQSFNRRLIRPMLECSPHDARALCTAAGWQWAEDHTNADVSRLRSALRHEVLPKLLGLRPTTAQAAVRLACIANDTRELLTLSVLHAERAAPPRRDANRSITWQRSDLRARSSLVLAETLKRAALQLTHGRGRDRLGYTRLRQAANLIRSSSTDPAELHWHDLILSITAHTVMLTQPNAEPD